MNSKLVEVLWAVFFTVVLGPIIGVFLFMYPLVSWFGFENTSKFGFNCSLAGMLTYWVVMITRNYLKKK